MFSEVPVQKIKIQKKTILLLVVILEFSICVLCILLSSWVEKQTTCDQFRFLCSYSDCFWSNI